MNSANHLLSPGGCELPSRQERASLVNLIKYPYTRTRIVQASVHEDQQNPYYKNLLDVVAQDSVGSMPIIIGQSPDNDANDSVEDRWIEWGAENSVGSSLRQLRRGACRTGVGIGIPYTQENSQHPVRLAYRIYSAIDLRTPRGATPEDRIINGIQYNEVWDPIRIFLRSRDTDHLYETDPIPHDIADILFWMKPSEEGQVCPHPECAQGLLTYPTLRRFLEATVKGEEFRASIPMFLKLNEVYGPMSAPPVGSFNYEPNTIPTLPPGTEVQGLNVGSLSEDRIRMARLMVSAAARCVNMPANLAFGDSSDHNMSSAQVDLQPWKNWIKNDRFDFSPVIRKAFAQWFFRASLTRNYFDGSPPPNFKYALEYDPLFTHPDPNKVASATLTDMISGRTSLHQTLSSNGINPRRFIQREIELLGITPEQYTRMLVSGRSRDLTDVFQENSNLAQETDDDEKQKADTKRSGQNSRPNAEF